MKTMDEYFKSFDIEEEKQKSKEKSKELF